MPCREHSNQHSGTDKGKNDYNSQRTILATTLGRLGNECKVSSRSRTFGGIRLSHKPPNVRSGTSLSMSNLASLLKTEITRLARKEVRATTSKLQKAVTSHRSEIAALKRRVVELERRLRQSQRGQGATVDKRVTPATENGRQKVRFSPKSLISQRKRLGLSAADVGLLFGTTGQSIYNWEAGRARPSARHMATLGALRKLGRRQAEKILEALRNG